MGMSIQNLFIIDCFGEPEGKNLSGYDMVDIWNKYKAPVVRLDIKGNDNDYKSCSSGTTSATALLNLTWCVSPPPLCLLSTPSPTMTQRQACLNWRDPTSPTLAELKPLPSLTSLLIPSPWTGQH